MPRFRARARKIATQCAKAGDGGANSGLARTRPTPPAIAQVSQARRFNATPDKLKLKREVRSMRHCSDHLCANNWQSTLLSRTTESLWWEPWPTDVVTVMRSSVPHLDFNCCVDTRIGAG